MTPTLAAIVFIVLVACIAMIAYDTDPRRPVYRKGCHECTAHARQAMQAREDQQDSLQHDYEHRMGRDCGRETCPRRTRRP